MKVKKWLLGFMTFAAMVVLCAVCAGAETYGDFEYGVLDDGTVQITDCETGAEKVVIPDTIDGKSVTSIGDSAFEQCISLTNITIPDSVTSISGGAFEQCTSLTNIVIPNSVTEIGEDAFRGCTSLTGITIPDGMMSIGKRAFWECKSLKTVTIPDSVTSIGIWAFRNCISLTAINVATENQNYVSVNGVLYNNDKTTIICYPAGKKDESYKIINGVTSIEGSAFKDCTSLKSITIPDSMTSLGDSAFEDCISLTSITIPGSVTSIGESAFYYCTSLTSVEIPNSVTSIGGWAFYDCTSLTSITIPNSVRSIGRGAFTNTALLENQTTTIKYVDKWVVECDDDVRSVKIKNGTVGVANMAFYGCEDLASITVPDSVTSICESAFKDCTSLTSITIPNSVMNIDDYTFSGCRSLTSVTIPNGVTYIGNEAFRVCTSLTGITLPDSVTSIGNSAFEWCENLTSITIPDSVMKIAENTFSHCTSLISVTIPNSVKSIDRGAFYGCTSLTSITIPKNVTSIGNNALGYSWSDYYRDDVKSDNFKIYCYSGTAGEQYAKDNSFTYELLDKPTLSKVTGVKLGGRAADALRINWTKNASADGYIVEMYQGNKWVRVAKITNNSTTTFRKSGLKAGTVYKFRVKAYKMYDITAAYSAYSATVTARTNPSVIKGAKLGGRAADALRINWTKNTSADGYIVEMYQGNKWVRVAKITNNSTTTFRKAGLKASTVYKFRVRAYKMSGKTALYGNYSTTVTARTNPSIVKGVKIGGKAKDALRVNWTKNASAQGYIVEMYKGGKWVRVAKITNSNTTTFRKAGLAKNTAYKFRVKAYYMSGKTALYGNYGSVSGKTAAK